MDQNGPNLPKKSISVQNWEKSEQLMNSRYLKFLGTKLLLQG